MLIKYGKELIESGDVGTETTIEELKSRLEFVTGCSDIKLILSGKLLIGGPRQENIGKLPGGLLAKISMMGTKKSVIDSLQNLISQPIERRIINDLDGSKATSGNGSSVDNRKLRPSSQYSFGSINTLPGLENEAHARHILEELSRDVGVLAVMEKHKFKVGVLCELYPEGYVGVSDVCVMGLNEGKGLRILLRLRTDDLKGFRKIQSIRDVLFHELAHNEHSDHDGQFYMLMRQIKKEVTELDWRNSKGKTTGSGHETYSSPSSGGYNKQQSQPSMKPHRLGGDSGDLRALLPARILAGTAAMMRLTPEEQEVESNCGSNNVPISNVSISETNNETGIQHDIIENNNQMSATFDTNMQIVSDSNMQIDNADSFRNMDITTNDSIDHAVDNSEIIREEEVIGNVINEVISDVITEKEKEMIGTDERKITASEAAEAEEIFFKYVAEKVMFQVDEAVAYALSLDVAGPVERMLMLKDALGILLRLNNPIGQHRDVKASDISETMQLLRTIIGNARNHPNDPKYKSVKKTTKIFTRLVENRIGASRILLAAGFEEKGEYFMLGRDDPGLLYLVDSILEQSIAIIVS